MKDRMKISTRSLTTLIKLLGKLINDKTVSGIYVDTMYLTNVLITLEQVKKTIIKDNKA